MDDIVFQRVQALLIGAGQAHGLYEASELGGEHDEAWARWYADWLIKHGLNDILGQTYGVESLSLALIAMAKAHKNSSLPRNQWVDFYASTLVHEAR